MAGPPNERETTQARGLCDKFDAVDHAQLRDTLWRAQTTDENPHVGKDTKQGGGRTTAVMRTIATNTRAGHWRIVARCEQIMLDHLNRLGSPLTEQNRQDLSYLRSWNSLGLCCRDPRGTYIWHVQSRELRVQL